MTTLNSASVNRPKQRAEIHYDFEEGTYILTEDVHNPSKDKRQNQDRLSSWKAWAVWPEGMIFIVSKDPEFDGVFRIKARGGIEDLLPFDSAYRLLAEKLEIQVETPSDYVTRVGGSIRLEYAMRLLDKLNPSMYTLADLMREIDEDMEREEEHS